MALNQGIQETMKKDEYAGFEQGPIRPPSEADSLLIRLTRNCPWNKCTFCPVYKGRKFSFRSVDNILKDIDDLHSHLHTIIQASEPNSQVDMDKVNTIFRELDSRDRISFNAAWHWYTTGMESIFLQDADSLVMKPDDIVRVLERIRKRFPMVKRITSYARSHTIVRIKTQDIQRISDAGLNRIHIGLESGSDAVLKMVKKGASKDVHIKAGRKVKNAGMELSEYVMPGLGGVDLSKEHALETADALNKINPDFIRLRTLAVPGRAVLAQAYDSGKFKKCTDYMMAQELKLFLENLDGITSFIKSDHILNLLEEVDGKMPGDKEKLVAVVDEFLDMTPEKRVIFQVGRRMGLFSRVGDMADPGRLSRVEETCRLHGVTPETVDSVIDELMKRFV